LKGVLKLISSLLLLAAGLLLAFICFLLYTVIVILPTLTVTAIAFIFRR
jgi:hypothetical protein